MISGQFRKQFLKGLGYFLFLACFISCDGIPAPVEKESIPPEHTAFIASKKLVRAKNMMVSAAHPLATQAGLQILREGGTAADAAVAVQMVLNVVEPQSSGIGGGLFLLYFDNTTKKISAVDGRETAPQKISSGIFLKPDGKPMEYLDALAGGKSVGVPGALKALSLLHQKYGRLTWKQLFVPAIDVARSGFPVSPRLSASIKEQTHLRNSPAAKSYFYEADGQTPLAVGHSLANLPLASAFELIAGQGIAPFYSGTLAQDMVAAVQTAFVQADALTVPDLENYRAKERSVICLMYRAHKVCGMPPPTSGGVTVLQILGILENFDLGKMPPVSAEAVHVFAEASRLAFADRNRYLADPDFVEIPLTQLLDKTYLKKRAGLITRASLKKAEPGKFKNSKVSYADGVSPELPGTSHFSIVDRWENAVAVTTSIEYAFGSTLMTNGFLLNNQLTDFSFVSEVKGKKVANRIEPGKRPRSSMAPMLVFDKEGDDLVLVLGSPGGAHIIDYVAQTLVAVLDWGMDIQQAIDMPRVAHLGGDLELEQNTALKNLEDELKARGHTVVFTDLNSGLHGIQVTKYGLLGGADPRREGMAVGE